MLLTFAVILAGAGSAQAPDHPTTPAPAKTHRPHPGKLATSPPVTPIEVAPTPAPEQPKWPANDQPKPASVTWNSQGLHIDAANASLHQIMNEVATDTGAKVEGLGADERVFGEFGPGQARDVISQLLTGSGYNVLLIGDQGQGTPRQIVLSARHASGTPGNANRPNSENPDEEPEQPEPDEPQQAPIAPVMHPPMGQPMQRTPQQQMQEMRQQQQQQPGQPPPQ